MIASDFEFKSSGFHEAISSKSSLRCFPELKNEKI